MATKEDKKTEVEENAKKVIEYLNKKTGRTFRKTENNLKLVRGRLNDGYTAQDFANVINFKTSQWLHKSDMVQYLRPNTLFTKNHFEEYLQASEATAQSSEHSSLINVNYKEEHTQSEIDKQMEDNRKKLEELRANWKGKKENSKPKNEQKEFDPEAPFRFGYPEQVEFKNYQQFVDWFLMKTDQKQEENKETQRAMARMLPKEIQEGLKKRGI